MKFSPSPRPSPIRWERENRTQSFWKIGGQCLPDDYRAETKHSIAVPSPIGWERVRVRVSSILCIAGFVLSAFSIRAADEIPARPEELKFPPLQYEPPDQKTFRVQLKNGPVAYVVPDRELPLVNISV